MLCSVYTTIAGEYDGPPFCTPIIGNGAMVTDRVVKRMNNNDDEKGETNIYIASYI